jgi:hypothetical protein
VLGNQVSGEYGSFSVWESKDDAEAADAMIAPQLQQALAGRRQGAPTRWFFDVVEPTQRSSPAAMNLSSGERSLLAYGSPRLR